ncbi:MAG: PIN domain-containing protein [Solirubrobacterales bacterium]
MEAASGPERMLCDTSFVAHIGVRRTHPQRYEHWNEKVLARIDVAILAISVVTLAEARFGYLKANWGQPRIGQEERRLGSFLQVPLDYPDLDEWARLKDLSKRTGIAISDNDLWIAATASTRDCPLVTCDRDQERLEPHLSVPVIYLPPHA